MSDVASAATPAAEASESTAEFSAAPLAGETIYWPVGLLAALATLPLALGAVATYTGGGGGGYAMVAAVLGLVLAANAISGLIAWRVRRGDIAVWLLVATTMVAALLLPLFVADASLPLLLALAAVPIQVATVDRLRRVVRVTLLALAAAAATVAVDLLEAPGRLTVLVDRPAVVVAVAVVLTLHLAGLVVLLWHLRLTTRTHYFVRLGLATQLPLLFTAISAVSILVVTGVLIAQIRDSQVGQVERNFRTLAEISAERVGNSLDQQVGVLLSLGRRSAILHDGLELAASRYPADPALRTAELRRLDAEWQSAPDQSPLVVAARSNEQSLELSRFRGADLLHNNVVLVDRYGGLVAAQGTRPARFYFADQEWWRAAFADGVGGLYLGDLTINPVTGQASLLMAVGVLDVQTNRTAGVLASTYQLGSIQSDIGAAGRQVSGDVRLIGPDGRLIGGPDPAEIGVITPTARLALGLPTDDRGSGGGVAGGADGQPSLVLGRAPLAATSLVNLEALRSLGWQVVVSDSQSVALVEVSRSTKVAALIGLIAIALGVLAVLAIARVVTRPIEALTATASAISAGDLDQRARPAGPVELVTLAEAFNTLTGRLRSLISSLQEQVAQRTAQLEARVDQLATLNRITQSVAAVHGTEAALGLVSRELLALFRAEYSGVALLEPAGDDVAVVAEHSRDGADGSAGLIRPLVGHLSSQEAIARGRSLVVREAQANPLSEPLHQLLVARATQSLMIVPLIVRGDVIGTLAVATDEPGREFSEAEVALAETVAGQVAGAIESSRLFSEMEAAKEAAETANEAKSTFLASVSHELRTPLTSVLGFAKVIRRQLEERILPHVESDDARTQKAINQVRNNVSIIVTEGERLTTLVNNVLDLAKIEAGRFEWQMQPVSIADVADRALLATAGLVEAKGLELDREVPDGLPEVMADRDGLVQVLINLLSNAVKFTDRGSVTCRAERSGEEVVVSVSDTGIGIAPADQERVFEKFVQVGDTLTDKPHGTGLGLPICREIVERHGGRIWVESVAGQGSTFSFALPLMPVDGGPPGDGDGRAGPATAGDGPARVEASEASR